MRGIPFRQDERAETSTRPRQDPGQGFGKVEVVADMLEEAVRLLREDVAEYRARQARKAKESSTDNEGT